MPDHECKPIAISGGISVDDRGAVSFINGLPFDDIRRFYIVSNHRSGFVRAWHAHKSEGKYVVAIQGAALVCAVAIENWAEPDRAAHVYRFVLSADSPCAVYVPPAYANGFMSLREDTRLMFFSTSTLEESRNDDYRYPARFWDPWSVEER
jgi:dTDP-4-dehydrorhamnose 3,5-epimerase-like enzyme